jgi:flavin reductase (DIM6/NTAB) family NADH-FMN oxidoreductase RutF
MYFNPNEIETKDLHQLLLGIVAPRPIAFVSTIDEEGIYNLALLAFLTVLVAILQ